MPGLLADVNVQGHLPYLVCLIDGDVRTILAELSITSETFPGRGLDRRMTDRALWNYCQEDQLVLFTDNRNHEDENSLNATIQDSWMAGNLPVLTLADKGKFDRSARCASRVANDVATTLYTMFFENVRDWPRIFVPL